ncbi:MAG TPA: AAA family ATPase [Dongiaceae bacterium]|nr:AAA family ATPase [Dongiaceae bacterium]
MRLIFLWGLPGAGKLTVARELGQLTGWSVFHNHLTVDLLLAVFPFASQPFIELREQIWISVIGSAAADGREGLIFTFNPENSVRRYFVEDVQSVVAKHGGQTEFVQVTCDERTIEQRLDSPDRRTHQKLTSLETYRDLKRRGVFDWPVMPAPQLRVDTTEQLPTDAAWQIINGLNLACAPNPGGPSGGTA